MRWKTRDPLGRFTVCESIEIDEGVESVFTQWSRLEDFPRYMGSVRRTKRVDDRVLWDVDIAGHQVVWEARVVESVADELVRWESSWGMPNSGEVCFEDLPQGRTRLTAHIAFRPRRALEHLGARLGLVDAHVRRDLERFRSFVETLREEGVGPRGAD